MKQSFSYIFGSRNIPLSSYINGFFHKAENFSKCQKNIEKTMLLYDKLGFVIDMEISQDIPIQRK